MRYVFNSEPEQYSEVPPTQPLELGKWHEKRGRFDEALSCFKQAAIETSLPSRESNDPGHSAQSWIEYGRLSARLNKYAEADKAFGHALRFGLNYAAASLREWASLMHRKGWSDRDIFNRLSAEASAHGIPPKCLGSALYEIGAYTEAALCFTMANYDDMQSGTLHVCCLVANSRLDEAINLIAELKHQFAPWNWSWNEEQSFISLAHFLCKWKIEGHLPFLPTCMEDRLKLAETAVSLGMIPEAEIILSQEGTSGEYILIHLLYAEGYLCKAEERLSRMEDLPIDLSVSYGARLQFITAERLYDRGQYERASALFQDLRLSKPDDTASRFGEAACYLQSALLSLSARIERLDCTETVKQQALEYMKSIHAALHIVESTQWHTSWTPAQLRRESGSCHAMLLN